MGKAEVLSTVRKLLLTVAFVLFACVHVYADDISKTVTLSSAGTLSGQISEDEKSTITKLKISGPINGTDLKLIRGMGKLSVLDMADAKIVAGGDAYNNNGLGTYYTTKNNVLGNSTFKYCSSLTEVILPSTITLMDDYAFSHCYNLKSVTIPSTVTEIANNVFLMCYSLESITIPSSVTRMRTHVFEDCSGLRSVTVLSDNLAIEEYTFWKCSSLTDVVVCGKNMPECDTNTFIGCNLSNIKLHCAPALIKQCTASPWSEIPIYANITLSSVDRLSNYMTNDAKYQVVNLKIDGVVKSDDTDVTMDMVRNGKLSVLDMADATTEGVWWDSYHDCPGLTSISLPYGYTTIGGNAFLNCTGLKSIGIPSTVTYMGNYVFENCSSLTDIEIPSRLQRIPFSAFEGCTSLKKVTIPSGVSVVDNNAFANCTGLTEITIASGGTEIYYRAFYGCTSLTKVTLLGNTLSTSCAADAFDGGSSSNATLFCREPLYDGCQENDPWKKFKDIKVWTWPITITDAGMATACFDQNLDVTSLGDDVKAYIASGFSPSSGKVLLMRVKQIPAGTGFILKAAEGTYDIPVSVTDYTYANLLVGTLKSTNLSEISDSYTNYVLGDGDSGIGFYLPTTDCVIPANKAYLQIPTSTAAAKRSIGISFEDEDDTTTGFISVKELKEGADGKSAVYDINGQRKQGLSKGLNIVDGKKIYIR